MIEYVVTYITLEPGMSNDLKALVNQYLDETDPVKKQTLIADVRTALESTGADMVVDPTRSKREWHN